MATTKDYNIPPARVITSVNGGPATDPDVRSLQSEVQKARARRELVQETKLTESMTNPPAPPEAPFQIRGGINLGEIDLQEQQRRAEERAAQERQESRQREQQLAQELNQTRGELTALQINTMKGQLEDKIGRLEAVLRQDGAGGQPKSLLSQIQEIQEISNILNGSNNAEAREVVSDASTRIALAKMDYEFQMRLKELELQSKKADRDWEMALEKMREDRDIRLAELGIKKQQAEIFGKAPEIIGRAIGDGIASGNLNGLFGRGQEAEGVIAQQKIKTAARQYHIEIGEGESGTIDCPNCQSPVSVSRTMSRAICAGCRAEFEIQRVPVGVEDEAEPEAVGAGVGQEEE